MKEVWNFERCLLVMNREIGLLKMISAVQKSMRQAVMNREWADFDENNGEVNRLGEEFACLEDERALLFSALSKDGYPANAEKIPFYASIVELPPEERMALSRLYRELKMEILKMRALNETFVTYLNEAKILAASYLEAVCPARGGKLYTRKGQRVSQDLRSIVFNNRF